MTVHASFYHCLQMLARQAQLLPESPTEAVSWCVFNCAQVNALQTMKH